ncbi:ABC-2 type transport system permease [Enterococcus sp. AZ194]|uniref:ABC transporter permease n=1 Tax=Enterococcus sp. AZ194 TaxID=2774629 RepID=UPI003F22EA29
MKKTIALIKYSMKRIISDNTGIIFAFLMPIGFYVVFSTLFNTGPDSKAMIQYLVPNYLLIIILNAVMNIFGMLLVSAEESGNLIKFRLMGVSKMNYAVSLFLCLLAMEIVLITLFLTFCVVFDGINLPLNNLVPCLVILVVAHLFQFALTMLLSAIVKKATTFSGVGLGIFMLQMFAGGLAIPIAMFPDNLRNILEVVNPVVHLSTALINTWVLGESLENNLGSILIVIGFSIACIVLSLLIQKARSTQATVKPIIS